MSATQQITIEEIAEQLGGIDLKDMSAVLRIIADKFTAHQQSNNGYVPREVFLEKSQIAGVYSAVEMVPVCDGRYFLKRRGPSEQGWHNLFHIPGKVLRPGFSFESVLDDLSVEYFGRGLQRAIDQSKVEYRGLYTYHAAERGGVDCFSAFYIYRADPDELNLLDGDWRSYSRDEMSNVPTSEVVDVHKAFLLGAEVPPLGILRLS